MNQFNLIDEHWIPVRTLEGQNVELGIKQVLLQARDLRKIEHPSPLVTVAFHRLLAAILYRALRGPTNLQEARRYFADGWPSEKINRYLEEMHDRFYLFHEERPFQQIAGFQPQNWRSWTVLAAEHNADNAKVLFDHVNVNDAGSITCKRAAQYLVAQQTFALSSGKSELSHTSTAPSATGIFVIPLGETLQDTLSFILVTQNGELLENDLPCWERPTEDISQLRAGISRRPAGLADLYTWRSRTVLLQGSSDGGVGKVAFASGISAENLLIEDPMVPYRKDEKRGYLPLQFNEKGIWRSFHSLLPAGKQGAGVIQHAVELTEDDESRFPRGLLVCGQKNEKARIDFWRMELFALPRGANGEPSNFERLLKESESAGKALREGVRIFFEHMMRHGETHPDQKEVQKYVNTSDVISQYWTEMERAFHMMLEKAVRPVSFEDILREWKMMATETMKKSWMSFVSRSSSESGWSHRALNRASYPIMKRAKMAKEDLEQGGVSNG